MASSQQPFYCLWQEEHKQIRNSILDLLSTEDLCNLRRANTACCNLVTKRLFIRTHLTFTPNTFTKPSRIQALSRIGHHIEHLTFTLPHSDATFLPPLIHPVSGQEISFLYTPYTSMASVLERPKYANTELGEILTQQYPPLFHAATNVPSFINAMKHFTHMRHLTVKTPGQDPKERYRRDIVDYALISLRISLERAPLTKLNKLSLSGVHPTAINYLRHVPGFGCLPSGARRWRQIKKLHIAVESWDFYGPAPGHDHLKILDDYIRAFAPQLEKLSFTWIGRKGPCPLALAGDALFAPPRSAKKLFNEVTSPMSPLPPAPAREPIHFPRLRYMQVRNATMSEPQIRQLVASHQETVREFDFECVALIGSGTWEEALAPLTGLGRESSGSASSGGGGVRRYHSGNSEVWSQHSAHSGGKLSEAGSGSFRTGISVTSTEEEQLPGQSAAAAAATKELLDVDLEGFVFGDMNDAEAVKEWARGVRAAAQESPLPDGGSSPVAPAAKRVSDDGGLASDIEAAKQASTSFSTKLKKRRIRKHKSKRHHRSDDGGSDDEQEKQKERQEEEEEKQSNRWHGIRHKHSYSDDTHSRHRSRSRSSKANHHHHGGHHHPSSSSGASTSHRRHRSEELPEMPAMPEVIGSDDEMIHPLVRSSSHRTPTPNSFSSSSPSRPPLAEPSASPQLHISAPILNPDPLPVLLQPTVYDPARSRSMPRLVRTDSGGSAHSHATTLAPVAEEGAGGSGNCGGSNGGLSAVQLEIEAELLAEADEAAARAGALRRARETVLSKLSREFCKRAKNGGGNSNSNNNNNNNNNDGGSGRGGDSAAARAVATTLSRLDLHRSASSASSTGGGGMRAFREGLFGKSAVSVLPDQRGADSPAHSLLVPLVFSRG